MQAKFTYLLGVLTLTFALPLQAMTPAPKDAEIHIISLEDGAALTSPVVVRFGVKNMSVAPAGQDKPNSGHFHLLVDVDQPPAMDQPIPKDPHHLHFGKGQTETELELAPGKHTLQLMMGDYQHIPHRPPVMSDKITITVLPR